MIGKGKLYEVFNSFTGEVVESFDTSEEASSRCEALGPLQVRGDDKGFALTGTYDYGQVVEEK